MINDMCVNRRQLLVGAAATTAVALASPYIARAQSGKVLKVSAFGGYFEDSLVEHVYPKFTEETGIAVQPVSQSGGNTWWTALRSGLEAGEPPADISMPGGNGSLRFQELFEPLDEAAFKNLGNVDPRFIARDPEGRPRTVAVMAWYTTFVTNTERFPNAPASWADLWSDEYAGSIGLNAVIETSYLLDITAVTFFGGQDILKTREGILKVMEKLAELIPRTALWYRDEGQFQQQLQSGEVPAGEYYHDVTLQAAKDGYPVRSTFPKEGGVIDYGAWAIVKTSKMLSEGQQFIDWFLKPNVQTLLTEVVGTAPVLPREKVTVSDEVFGKVASSIPPIVPAFQVYIDNGDWIAERWAEVLAK